MKISTVKSSWLAESNLRLDTSPYLSGGLEVRARLRKLKLRKDRLENLTTGPEGGIYNGPKFVRNYLDSAKYGVPFMTGSSMRLADGSRLPFLRREDAHSPALRHLEIKPEMTLISCSGTIGKMAYARETMRGVWASQDVLKIIPDPDKIPSGYLYAFLCGRYGVPLISAGTYGSVIKHLEPHHLAPMEVPRLGDKREAEVHSIMQRSARLLSDFSTEIQGATGRFFESVGLKDITAEEWHADRDRDLGFEVNFPNPFSFRSLNFSKRFDRLVRRLKRVPYRPLGDLTLPDGMRTGPRFKRIEANEEYGARLVGQKELFNLKPEGRWIAKLNMPDDLILPVGTIVVAAHGTLGDSELYCRAEFVWGQWTHFAFTQDVLRISVNPEAMPAGCLYAFLRSETAFRMFRSISTGGKLQEPHYYFLPRLPVPIPSPADIRAIDKMVTLAYQKRHEAVALEDRAIELVESALDSA